ncbi:DUF308 domain-containing protein [Patescibacteria group bacterium]|nr:DUF308 domain-containing protein [Patescibacteria group bacterium]MBU1673588.1 DUF308 domain-containing protein [Patescibacteria group bacterium]
MGEMKTSTMRWLMVGRGVIFLLLGLIALFYPGLTVVGLVWFFGILAILSGIVAFVHAATEKNWVYVFEGILSIVLGILVMTYPGITAAVVVWFLVIWLLLVGLMMFVVGVAGPKGTPRAMAIISGIIMLILSLFLMVQPVWLKAWDILLVLGILALLSGIVQILFAVFAKKTTVKEVAEG